MTKTLGRKQAARLCHRAIDLIWQTGALPTPTNFELFYAHALGSNKALCEAVEQTLSEQGALTSLEADKLYETYLAPGSEGEDIQAIGGKLDGEIEQVMKIVQEAVNSTDAFDVSLDQVNSGLGDGSDPELVKRVVATLVQATKKMGQGNLDLKERLAESAKQVDQVKRELDAVRSESLTDALTRVANRKSFDRTLDQEIAQVKITGLPLCLCIIDIDHFKRFNDTFGHQAGDMVLKEVAGLFKYKIRFFDRVARYGGEEFAVIMPNTDLDAAIMVAERIRQSLMKKELIVGSTGMSMGKITISVGVGRLKPEDSAQSLIERADVCLYTAKHAGRNRVVCETSLSDNNTVSAESAA
jgi:diguanylate cyclase